jgi:SNF2 family DNA or RNA helicase
MTASNNNKLFKFRSYQEKIVTHIVQNPRCGVFSFMGSGKTASVLLAVSGLLFLKEVSKVLILAPLRVANTVWKQEAALWQNTTHLKINICTGVNRVKHLADTSANIYVLNYDTLDSKEVAKYLIDFDMVICDESTRIKSFRGGFSKLKDNRVKLSTGGGTRVSALAKAAFKEKVKRFVILTGTPSPQGVKDIWGQHWFLDAGARLGRNYAAFQSRWMKPTFAACANKQATMQYVMVDGAEEHVQKLVSELCISIRAEDYYPIEEPIKQTLYVEFPETVKKQYKQMEKDFIVELQAGNVEAVNEAAKCAKLIQIASGTGYKGEEKEVVEYHHEKIKALESLVEESSENILVSYWFNCDAVKIAKAFPYAKVLDKSEKMVNDWNAGKIKMLLIHPQSAGHGLNLQHGGRTIVFYTLPWSAEQYQQVIERIGCARQKASGYKRSVFVYDIQTRSSIDQVVKLKQDKNFTTQQAFLKAIAERN